MKSLLALLLLTAVAHAKRTIPTVDEKLENGLRVIVARDSTVNSIGVFVRHDDCAAALAQPAKIDEALDAIDGFVSTNLEPSHFDVYTQVPAGGLELALWFEAQRMTHPASIETTLIEDEYSMIDATIEKALRPHVAIAKDEARRCVAPERTTIAIVGRVDVKSALSMTRKYFATFATSNIPARPWEATFAESQSLTLQGPEPKTVTAWTISRALEPAALIAAERLAAHGLETEVRDGQFRLVGDSVVRLDEMLGGDTKLARRLAETTLLQKLESLRYRASVLAGGVDLDRLRADIAKTSDLGEFAELLATAPSITVEVPR